MDLEGQDELTKLWFEDLKACVKPYAQPILEDQAVEDILHTTKLLQQDTHVFIMSVVILEKYIYLKKTNDIQIQNTPLATVTAIFICSKYVGAKSALLVHNIHEFLLKTTKCSVTPRDVRKMELDILKTLKGILPVTTITDDLKTFIEAYVKPRMLTGDITSMALEVLCIVYTKRKTIMHQLQLFYSKNQEGLLAYKGLVTKRLHLVIGIVLCTFRLKEFEQPLDLDPIVKELAQMADVHIDHIQLFCQTIFTIIQKNFRSGSSQRSCALQ